MAYVREKVFQFVFLHFVACLCSFTHEYNWDCKCHVRFSCSYLEYDLGCAYNTFLLCKSFP